MPYPYFSSDELQSRLGHAVFTRALEDPSVVEELRQDASAKLAGVLRINYSLEAVAANTPREVVRIALDIAKVYVMQRYPELFPDTWVAYADQCTKELTALGKGQTQLDVTGTPEPAANTHSEFVTSDETISGKLFSDATWDY